MSEHFTRGTLECTSFCNRCEDFTQHRVDGGRKGPCLRCIERLEKEIAIRKGEEAAEERVDQFNPEGACSWMDDAHTLCSNPMCIANVPLDLLLDIVFPRLPHQLEVPR